MGDSQTEDKKMGQSTNKYNVDDSEQDLHGTIEVKHVLWFFLLVIPNFVQ